MAADIKKIKEILKVFEKSNFNEIEWEETDFKIRVKKAPPEVQGFIPSATSPIHVHTEDTKRLTGPPGDRESEIELTEGRIIIRSPLVGTFYRAPSPNASNFVNEGDMIKPGQVLCIIEAMKLMNEVESDRAGKIVGILVQNAQPVEYGEPLFIIETETI